MSLKSNGNRNFSLFLNSALRFQSKIAMSATIHAEKVTSNFEPRKITSPTKSTTKPTADNFSTKATLNTAGSRRPDGRLQSVLSQACIGEVQKLSNPNLRGKTACYAVNN